MLQKVKNRLKDQRGLTLIELLAVIVILGIIAAIAVPSIMNVIDKSKVDAVKSDAIQVINAANLYIAAEGYDGTAITGAELNSYVDNVDIAGITAISVEDATTGGGKVIKLTGTITNNDKTITLKAATLDDIKNDTTDDDADANAPVKIS
ncbi:type II secretion system protein [Mesobacillus maritimus]|uniref:type II secretion system protein n=1 Tax=Mesobacillus maritimus TaxID=1643336 RepID=UPI00384F6F66